MTYPLVWSPFPEDVRNYRQCLLEYMILKGTYQTLNIKDTANRFFEGGGFDFLVYMEQRYENCASICETPLFYLTRDMDQGIPD